MLCLQYIPMPVLYGVFLYMGVASLSGIQVGVATAMGVHRPDPQILGTRVLQFALQFIECDLY